MRINKKILAGLTAVSMLTCGIWMESVFAADTFSAEETEEAVSDTVTDLSAESITGTETEDVPVMDTAEPENKSEISETPEMSDERQNRIIQRHKIHQKHRKKQSFRKMKKRIFRRKCSRMIREISRKQHLRRTQHRKIWKQKPIRQKKRAVFAERRRIPYPGALMKAEFSRSQDREP